MLLTVTTTGSAGRPATDLGFLLHKHPDKLQSFGTAHGTAHVFYPEADADRCTAALLLEVDPIGLVRRGRGAGAAGRGSSPDYALAQYVNDRPYAASSLLSVALGSVFKTALHGRCDARPELAAQELPLEVFLPAVPVRAGADGREDLVRRLFEPLGWAVEADPVPLDEQFPEWGDSPYLRLRLTGTRRLADALTQLYVLLPVLDDAKHYWTAPDEVDKLLQRGASWLAGHPERELITRRYLARRWSLAREAMRRLEIARLAEADDREVEEVDNAVPQEEADTTGPGDAPAPVDGASPAPQGPADDTADGTAGGAAGGTAAKPPSLAEQRREAILAALHRAGAARVLDLGCGEGTLLARLLADHRFQEVVGVEVSARALLAARRRLHLDRLSERQAARIRLLQGALTYTDDRLKGYDAAVLSEVVEHVDPPRLSALEFAVFGAARPGTVVVTTPNAEYNVRWESLPAGHVRHPDHRFEWTRAEFEGWAAGVARGFGYRVAFEPVGPVDPEVGAPTQLAVFTRADPTDPTDPATAISSNVTATATALTRPKDDVR